MTLHVLRVGDVCLVVDDPAHGSGYPAVLHWGRDLGDIAESDAAALVLSSVTALVNNQPDIAVAPNLLPVEADLWRGRPGLSAHRGGVAVYPRWSGIGIGIGVEGAAGSRVVTAIDTGADLALTTAIQLDDSGIVTLTHTLTNTTAQDGVVGAGGDEVGGAGAPLDLAGLLAYLPVPHQATEVLDLTGRWARERSPQRSVWLHGGRVRESRRGRTGHDATLIMALGSTGFGFRAGEVWATHVGWSGDHVHLAERHPDGGGPFAGLLGGGELLRTGEVRLAPGESYTTCSLSSSLSSRRFSGCRKSSSSVRGGTQEIRRQADRRRRPARQGRSVKAVTCLGRTIEKWRRSMVIISVTVSRSAAATMEASTVPSRKSRYCATSSAIRSQSAAATFCTDNSPVAMSPKKRNSAFAPNFVAAKWATSATTRIGTTSSP